MTKRNRLTKIALVALGCSMLATPGFAASPWHKPEYRSSHEESRRGDDHRGRHDARHDDRRDDRHHTRRHARPSWMHRGGKMPRGQYGRTVDYRQHHLRRPPAGHRWVRNDDTYVLVAVTTGIIASIIAANR